MTEEERYICNQQRELYEYAQQHGADIQKFSDEFLQSSFCNNSLDKPYSVDQYADIMNWLEFLEPECKIEPDVLQKNKVSYNVAGWLGFVYRHLHFSTGLCGKELCKKVPVTRLILAYPGLHTVDEDMAIEIIVQDLLV